MCTLDDYKKLRLCYMHRPLVEQELGMWHEHYLPVGKQHLDGGAGCGETVYFYLQHGAEKVLAIDDNGPCIENLRYNFKDDPRVQIVEFHVDSMKWDIEGSEIGTVFEAHKPFKVRRLTGFPESQVTLNRIEEDWGSSFRKARRKLGTFLLQH